MFCFTFSSIAFAEETNSSDKKDKQVSNQYIVVNKSANKLAFYDNGVLVNIFNVATGRDAKATPEGDFDVATKWNCPIYYKTHKGGCEAGNPLGNRWIGLGVPGTSGYTYGIHGNNAEWSIGTYASAGCVRMHNWQVEQLFEIVEVGAKVTITKSDKSFDEIVSSKGYKVNQPVKSKKQAYLYEPTKAYYGLNEHLSSDKKYESGTYTITESINDWKKLKDKNNNTFWTNSNSLITEKFHIEKDAFYTAIKGSTLSDSPLDKKAVKTLSLDRVLPVLITTKTNSLVDFNGEKLWIDSSKIVESNQNSLIEQQNSAKTLFSSLKKSL